MALERTPAGIKLQQQNNNNNNNNIVNNDSNNKKNTNNNNNQNNNSNSKNNIGDAKNVWLSSNPFSPLMHFFQRLKSLARDSNSVF